MCIVTEGSANRRRENSLLGLVTKAAGLVGAGRTGSAVNDVQLTQL